MLGGYAGGQMTVRRDKALLFLCSLILLTGTFLFSQCVSAQTTIVAVRAINGIIIAADSLQKVIIPSTGPGVPEKSVRQSVCKIYQFGNIFYATSGPLLSNPKTGFIVDKIIAESFRKDKDIADNADRFKKEIQNPLMEALDNVKTEYPTYFERSIYGHEPVQILIAGIENNVPILVVLGFKVVSSLHELVRIESSEGGCKGSICQQNPFYIALGKHDALDRYVDNNPNIWNAGIINAARRLVEVEIADKPEDVGPPVDILFIGLSQIQWIQKKPACPATHYERH
jgi:hypothetical protein